MERKFIIIRQLMKMDIHLLSLSNDGMTVKSKYKKHSEMF